MWYWQHRKVHQSSFWNLNRIWTFDLKGRSKGAAPSLKKIIAFFSFYGSCHGSITTHESSIFSRSLDCVDILYEFRGHTFSGLGWVHVNLQNHCAMLEPELMMMLQDHGLGTREQQSTNHSFVTWKSHTTRACRFATIEKKKIVIKLLTYFTLRRDITLGFFYQKDVTAFLVLQW